MLVRKVLLGTAVRVLIRVQVASGGAVSALSGGKSTVRWKKKGRTGMNEIANGLDTIRALGSPHMQEAAEVQR